MGRNKKYGNITLTDEDRIDLEKLSKSQTGEYRKVQRAKILLMSASGMLNSEIAAAIGVHPNTAASIVTKYISSMAHFKDGLLRSSSMKAFCIVLEFTKTIAASFLYSLLPALE